MANYSAHWGWTPRRTASPSSLTWQRGSSLLAARLPHATSCLLLHPPLSLMSHSPPTTPVSPSDSSPLFLSSLVSLYPLLSPFFPPFRPIYLRLRYRTRLARLRRAYSSLSLLPPPSPSSPLLPPPPPSSLLPSPVTSPSHLISSPLPCRPSSCRSLAWATPL